MITDPVGHLWRPAGSASYPDHQLPVPVELVHDPDYVMPVFQ